MSDGVKKRGRAIFSTPFLKIYRFQSNKIYPEFGFLAVFGLLLWDISIQLSSCIKVGIVVCPGCGQVLHGQQMRCGVGKVGSRTVLVQGVHEAVQVVLRVVLLLVPQLSQVVQN